MPIDNNWIGSRIRPVAQGRVNWLFAGSLRSGRRLVAIMGLNQSATFAGHDAHAYLKDVLAPLPNYPASGLGALLPRRRQRVSSAP